MSKTILKQAQNNASASLNRDDKFSPRYCEIFTTSSSTSTSSSSIPPSPQLNFICLGDFGKDTQEIKEVSLAMNNYIKNVIKKENQSKLDFILGLGDNFYPYGVNSPSDPNFQLLWRDLFLIHDELRNIPWRLILGNHDYMGNPYAQIVYHYHPEVNSDRSWYMPSTSYSFMYNVLDTESGSSSSNASGISSDSHSVNSPDTTSGSTPVAPSVTPSSTCSRLLFSNSNTSSSSSSSSSSSQRSNGSGFSVKFFGLDTNACQDHVAHHHRGVTQFLHEDIDSLKSNVNKSTAQWNILFGHHPVHTKGSGHSHPAKILRENKIQRIINGVPKMYKGFGLGSVLTNSKFDAYFTGHEHVFQYIHANNTNHFCCGNSGADIRGRDGFYLGENKEIHMDWYAGPLEYGFVAVCIEELKMTVRFVGPKGQIYKEFIIEK